MGVCGIVWESGGRPTCFSGYGPFFAGEPRSCVKLRSRGAGWSVQRVLKYDGRIGIPGGRRAGGFANLFRSFFDPAIGRIVREVFFGSIGFEGRGRVPLRRRRGNPRRGDDRVGSRGGKFGFVSGQETASLAIAVESSLNDLRRKRGPGGLAVPIFEAG